MVQRSRKQTFCILFRGEKGKVNYTHLWLIRAAFYMYCEIIMTSNEGMGPYKTAFPHVLMASTNRFEKEAVQHISQAFRLIAPTFPIGWRMSGSGGNV